MTTAEEIVTAVRAQNWKNGGVLCMDNDEAEQLIEDAIRDAEQAAVAREWLPIETAPKDGTWFIAAWDDESRLAKWLDNSDSEFGPWEGWVVPSMFPRPHSAQPTKWMPMPTPPATAIETPQDTTGTQ